MRVRVVPLFMTLSAVTLIFGSILSGSVFADEQNVVQINGNSNISEIGDFEFLRKQFNWMYDPSTDEYFLRTVTLKESIKRHVQLNARSLDSHKSAKYGINKFSDLSPREFKERYLTALPEKVPKYPELTLKSLAQDVLPQKFDWRDKNAVTPVENQGLCGGCWAFSVVGAMESVHANQGHPLQQLSVQQVIDCSYENEGCNGGSTVRALHWLIQTKEKLVNQSEYPFKAVTGVCRTFPPSHYGISVKDFAAFDFRNEEAMKEKLVAWGPLVVTVDAMSWQDYLGGIIQHHCSSHQANHAVLITGYDATGEVPYWIVRNSWGLSWGNQGYVYVKMGGNVCGIADSVAAVFL